MQHGICSHGFRYMCTKYILSIQFVLTKLTLKRESCMISKNRIPTMPSVHILPG